MQYKKGPLSGHLHPVNRERFRRTKRSQFSSKKVRAKGTAAGTYVQLTCQSPSKEQQSQSLRYKTGQLSGTERKLTICNRRIIQPNQKERSQFSNKEQKGPKSRHLQSGFVENHPKAIQNSRKNKQVSPRTARYFHSFRNKHKEAS